MAEKRIIICGIYKITSPSGKIYVGKSDNIHKAWRNRYKNYNCENQRLIYRSLKKYGWEKHTFEIIEVCQSNHLNYYEIYYIWFYETYRTPHGMNLTVGGEGSKGCRWNEEQRKKHSDGHKRLYANGYIAPATGTKRSEFGMKGKKHKEESKQKQRDKMKGRIAWQRIILNTENGIFYIGAKDASVSIDLNEFNLRNRLTGRVKNNTPFIYA